MTLRIAESRYQADVGDLGCGTAPFLHKIRRGVPAPFTDGDRAGVARSLKAQEIVGIFLKGAEVSRAQPRAAATVLRHGWARPLRVVLAHVLSGTPQP